MSNSYAFKKVWISKPIAKSKKYRHKMIRIQTSIFYYYYVESVSVFIYFRKVVSGVQLTNGKVEKANIYVLAMGIMANPMGRSIGINLPVYPLKGNIVTVPLKVQK